MLEFLKSNYGELFRGELPTTIGNVGRFDLLRWLRELDFKTMVEVGIADGVYSQAACELNPQLKIYGVDPYHPYSDYHDYVRPVSFATMKMNAYKAIKPYLDRYEMMEMTSMEAVKRFSDNSIDFVYIDGNHKDPWISDDIREWTKKVKPRGIVAGHDYIQPHGLYDVKKAVIRYTNEHKINPWFVLGWDAKVRGMIRENCRSWMFVK